jgi:hypothetical protein
VFQVELCLYFAHRYCKGDLYDSYRNNNLLFSLAVA